MNGKAIFAFSMLLLVLSFIPIFPDPYEHTNGVDFRTWLKRELSELWSGER